MSKSQTREPIFRRNQIDYSPPFIVDGSDPIGLTEGKRSDPSSVYFEYPDDLLPLTPWKLTGWLKECHKEAGLKFLEPFGRHLKPAKKLMAKHGYDDLIRAVKRASQLSRFPFTFRFVERIINEH